MLPGSECLLYPSVPEGCSMIYPDEHDSLPALMRLYADTFTLAAHLAFLAARLRKEKQSQSFAEFDPRTEDINHLRREFSRLWESPDISYWNQHQDRLPRRSREILQQVSLFHAGYFALDFNFVIVSYPLSCLPAVLLQQHVAWSTFRVRPHA